MSPNCSGCGGWINPRQSSLGMLANVILCVCEFILGPSFGEYPHPGINRFHTGASVVNVGYILFSLVSGDGKCAFREVVMSFNK